MEWFSSGTALIEGLKWPLTVMFLAFFLKGPINGVISRIERISHNGTTINVASVPTLGDRNVDPVVVDARTENAVLSAPRAAMIESWLRLELAVADVLEENSVTDHPSSPDGMIHALFAEHLVDGLFYEFLVGIKDLRDRATLDYSLTITSAVARRYAETTEEAIQLLKRQVALKTTSSDV